MGMEHVRATWKADENVLAQIGADLFAQPTEVEVRIPCALADAAVRAWQRDEVDVDDEYDVDTETCEERIVRHRAGALALIGLALDERGLTDGDAMTVSLDAWFIGDALNAADDYRLLRP
jgi:hypothetical protein